MNALRNKVQLIGRLGKDAETITFDDGKVKARFPVATNETFRNSEGEKVEPIPFPKCTKKKASNGVEGNKKKFRELESRC